MVNEHLDDSWIALGNGPHQGRRTAPGLLRVDLGSVVQQHLERVGLPGACRHHERRVSKFRQRGIGVCSGLDELFDHRCIPVKRGELERCGAFAVRGRHICAGADQQIRNFQIIRAHRPMQRRRAINLWGIYIGLPLQQETHSLLISLHGRVS